MKRMIAVVIVAIAFALGFVISSSMTVLPKDLGTANRILALENAIRAFAKDRRGLPANLEELVEAGYIKGSQKMDRWGNAIEYDIVESNRVSLISHGDRGIVRTFGCEYVISKTFKLDEGGAR